jgi:hypothetical protein
LYLVTHHTTPHLSKKHNITQHHTSLHFITLHQPTPHHTTPHMHIHTYPHNLTTIYRQPYHTTQYCFTLHSTQHRAHTHAKTHTHTHIYSDRSNIFGLQYLFWILAVDGLQYSRFGIFSLFPQSENFNFNFFYSISYFFPSRTVVVQFSVKRRKLLICFGMCLID